MALAIDHVRLGGNRGKRLKRPVTSIHGQEWCAQLKDTPCEPHTRPSVLDVAADCVIKQDRLLLNDATVGAPVWQVQLVDVVAFSTDLPRPRVIVSHQ